MKSLLEFVSIFTFKYTSTFMKKFNVLSCYLPYFGFLNLKLLDL